MMEEICLKTAEAKYLQDGIVSEILVEKKNLVDELVLVEKKHVFLVDKMQMVVMEIENVKNKMVEKQESHKRYQQKQVKKFANWMI